MKVAHKAALYSALIWPGAGLWQLKFYRFSLFFALPALLLFVLIMLDVWVITHQLAQELSDDFIRTGNLDIDALLVQIRTAISANPDLVFNKWLLLGVWLTSIVSSYLFGLKSKGSRSQVKHT